MKTFFLFIDGLGIGELSNNNPFSFCKDSLLYQMIYEQDDVYHCKPIDARLGIEGLPQSGTGHVTILTGKNASENIGKHHGPFPHTTQRPWLLDNSIGTYCNQHDLKWDVLNAYPPPYFKALEDRKIRLSSFAYMQTGLGKKMYSAEDLSNGMGFPSLLSFKQLQIFGVNLPSYSIEESVSILVDKFKDLDLVIIEYFILDHLGHDKNITKSIQYIEEISDFLTELKKYKNELSVIITSDHGNVEDCSVKTHTLNRVPFITNQKLTTPVQSLVDIKTALIESLYL